MKQLETDMAADNAALCMAVHDLRQESTAYQRGLDEGRAKAMQIVRQLIQEPALDIPPATGWLCPSCQEHLGNKKYGVMGMIYRDVYRAIVALLGKPYPLRSFLLPDALHERNERLQRKLQHSQKQTEHLDDLLVQLREENQRLRAALVTAIKPLLDC